MTQIKFFALCAFALFVSACSRASSNKVVLETDLGNIEVRVYPDKAPLSSDNFLYYVDNGLYDNQGFYRAVRPQTDPRNLGMQIIQGGRLDLQAITAHIDHETTEMTGLAHIDGAVSIARDEPGTGSAAFFFISVGNNAQLDFGGARNPDGQGYAVFGHVIKGMDVVRAIHSRETGGPSDNPNLKGQFLTQPVKILKAHRK